MPNQDGPPAECLSERPDSSDWLERKIDEIDLVWKDSTVEPVVGRPGDGAGAGDVERQADCKPHDEALCSSRCWLILSTEELCHPVIPLVAVRAACSCKSAFSPLTRDLLRSESRPSNPFLVLFIFSVQRDAPADVSGHIQIFAFMDRRLALIKTAFRHNL